MSPIGDALTRLQEIADRIAQIRSQSTLPPTLRSREASQTDSTAAASATGQSASGLTDTSETEASRFQMLLDQALTASEIGSAATSADSSSFDLLNQMVGSSGSTAGSSSSSEQLAQYQQMLLDAIRRGSTSGT